MTDRDYAIKSMKEITFQMANHAQNYLEVTIERHYTDIKELMTSYQKLILENQVVLEELDMECQEKINEDMAYALSYLSIYNNQLNVPKMCPLQGCTQKSLSVRSAGNIPDRHLMSLPVCTGVQPASVLSALHRSAHVRKVQR